MKKKILYISLIVVIVIIAVVVYGYSVVHTGFNIDKTVYVYIDENKDYNALLNQIRDSAKVESVSNFDMVASVLSYKDNMKTGLYAVAPSMTVYDLLKVLRSGHQTPVRLKFNNIRTKDDLAKRIADQLMMPEESLLDKLDDPDVCRSLGFTPEDVVAMFIPNTYEIYWNIDTDDFLQRMKKEYSHFWDEKRVSKAKEIGLSPTKVSILASIVEEECTFPDEYPVVAGLYLNRLRIGQPLQADPTVKFAVGDFSLRRVLNKHLEVNSPYNTYRYAGLPPGPIRIPSIKGIDAVLNYDKNDYLYMCAKEDFSGRHNFARTHAEHQVNATRYRNALDARGIK